MHLAVLYGYNCDCEFGVFCHEWTMNFPIFSYEKFTALLMNHCLSINLDCLCGSAVCLCIHCA